MVRQLELAHSGQPVTPPIPARDSDHRKPSHAAGFAWLAALAIVAVAGYFAWDHVLPVVHTFLAWVRPAPTDYKSQFLAANEDKDRQEQVAQEWLDSLTKRYGSLKKSPRRRVEDRLERCRDRRGQGRHVRGVGQVLQCCRHETPDRNGLGRRPRETARLVGARIDELTKEKAYGRAFRLILAAESIRDNPWSLKIQLDIFCDKISDDISPASFGELAKLVDEMKDTVLKERAVAKLQQLVANLVRAKLDHPQADHAQFDETLELLGVLPAALVDPARKDVYAMLGTRLAAWIDQYPADPDRDFDRVLGKLPADAVWLETEKAQGPLKGRFCNQWQKTFRKLLASAALDDFKAAADMLHVAPPTLVDDRTREKCDSEFRAAWSARLEGLARQIAENLAKQGYSAIPPKTADVERIKQIRPGEPLPPQVQAILGLADTMQFSCNILANPLDDKLVQDLQTNLDKARRLLAGITDPILKATVQEQVKLWDKMVELWGEDRRRIEKRTSLRHMGAWRKPANFRSRIPPSKRPGTAEIGDWEGQIDTRKRMAKLLADAAKLIHDLKIPQATKCNDETRISCPRFPIRRVGNPGSPFATRRSRWRATSAG